MKFQAKYKTNVKLRSDLLTLLSEACEIEHGLACSYLYSAFTLKQEVSEGLTAQQLQSVKKWASQIFFVASQEMLHLSQAWNLLSSIGGTPYYFRPNFPQGNKYYPFNIPLKLEPFSLETLNRFIFYELPADIDEKVFLADKFGFVSEDEYSYKSVGQLYQLILDGFTTIDEKKLFIGNAGRQLGSDEIDFKEIVKVTDRETAITAIHMITEQGEGNKEDRADCHYGIFKSIEKEYKEYLNREPNFSPSRNTISNPIVFDKTNYSSDKGTLIININTRAVADIFDDIYDLILRMLQHSFSNTVGNKIFNKAATGFSIHLMVRVIKPLGESLTMMPAYNDVLFQKAGPAFGLTRHIPLPNNNEIVTTLINERSAEIIERIRIQPHFPNKDNILLHYSDVLNSFLVSVAV